MNTKNTRFQTNALRSFMLIILIVAAVVKMASGQPTGYNARFLDKFDGPQMQLLADTLAPIAADQKVIRFPGGSFSRDFDYSLPENKQYVERFLDFCDSAGVESLIFVFSIDWQQYHSFELFQRLAIEKNILVVEFGNEQYLAIPPNFGWSNFWLGIFNPRAFARKYVAEQYLPKLSALVDHGRAAGVDLAPIMAVNGPTPANQMRKGWLDAITASQWRKIGVHYYGNPEKIQKTFTLLDAYLNYLKAFEIYITETAPIDHGADAANYREFVGSDIQRQLKIGIESIYKNHAVKCIVWHTIAHEIRPADPWTLQPVYQRWQLQTNDAGELYISEPLQHIYK